MPLLQELLSFWRKNSSVLSLSLYSLAMLAFEKVVEIEFHCPEQRPLQVLYVASYFLCPALVVFLLSATGQAACVPCARCARPFSCCQRGRVLCQASLTPLVWWVILLCDGRYVSCLAPGGGESTTRSTTRSTPEATASPSEAFIWSQVAGLVLLAAVVCLYSLCYVWPPWFCCGCDGGEGEEEEGEEEEGEEVELGTLERKPRPQRAA